MDSSFEDLVQTYFNQDWQLHGQNAQEVVEAFAADMPVDDILAAREAALRLLRSENSDDELESVLRRTGLEYNPRAHGTTMREWLGIVSETLESAARGNRNLSRDDGDDP